MILTRRGLLSAFAPVGGERLEITEVKAVPLKVPLKVDFGSGKNWLEAH